MGIKSNQLLLDILQIQGALKRNPVPDILSDIYIPV